MNTIGSPRRDRKRKPWYWLPVPILIVAGALVLHFHRLHQARTSPPPEPTPWALQTERVERGSVQGSIQSVAVIETAHDIVLFPQIQGTVLAVGPRAGVAVKRGQVLVRIDARDIAHELGALQQQRTAALADADYAGKQQARIDAVFVEGGVSQAQVDQARTATQGAHAKALALTDRIAALRVKLGYAEIRAPRDAIVAERMINVGDTVGPGRSVYRLTVGKRAVVRVGLPAAELTRVRIGDELELRQGLTKVQLRITRMSPAVNAAGLGTAEADARVAPFDLPSGSTVVATVHTGSNRKTLTVPMSALVGRGTGAHVVVFVPGQRAGMPGRLRWVPVEVVQRGSSRAAVRGRLTPGERVVVGQTAVLAQLREGDAAITGVAIGR